MCVCVFSSYSFRTSSSLDVPAGVTQEEGHAGFFIHLPSAVCVCVFFPFILDIKFVGRTSRAVTQEEGHTGFIIHLLSAVRALIFLARRIQPFLSLVDREVGFCVLTI